VLGASLSWDNLRNTAYERDAVMQSPRTYGTARAAEEGFSLGLLCILGMVLYISSVALCRCRHITTPLR
jgi:hypothetical protein